MKNMITCEGILRGGAYLYENEDSSIENEDYCLENDDFGATREQLLPSRQRLVRVCLSRSRLLCIYMPEIDRSLSIAGTSLNQAA